MRVNHELERGIICERCNRVAYKHEYLRISTFKPVVEDTTGRYKAVHRMNLCRECYNKYRNTMKEFLDEGNKKSDNK